MSLKQATGVTELGGGCVARQQVSILWGSNSLQRSSSEVLVKFSAKQMTSLIKCTDTLPKSSLIAILTFGRGTFKPN